jgi:hypothetical protein
VQFNGSWMQEDRRHPSFCRLLRCSKAFVLQERVRSLMQQSSRALDSVTENQRTRPQWRGTRISI